MAERRPIIGTCISPYSGVHTSTNIRGLANLVLSSPAAWADTELEYILDTRPDIAMVRRPLGNEPEPAIDAENIRLEYLWWNSTERHPESMSRPDAVYNFDYSTDYKKLLVELTFQVHRILKVCQEEDIDTAVYIGPIYNYRVLNYTTNLYDSRSATELLAKWAEHYGVGQVIIDSAHAMEGFYEAGKVFRAHGVSLVGEGSREDYRTTWFARASNDINTYWINSQFRRGILNYGLLPYWIGTGHEKDNGDIRLNFVSGGSGSLSVGDVVFQGPSYELATATGIINRVDVAGLDPFVLLVTVTGTWAPGIVKRQSTGGLSGWTVETVQRGIRETPEELHGWYDLGYHHFWGWTRRGDQLLREAFPLDGIVTDIPSGDSGDPGDVIEVVPVEPI